MKRIIKGHRVFIDTIDDLVDDRAITKRTASALKKAGIRTVLDLCRFVDDKGVLRHIDDIGKKGRKDLAIIITADLSICVWLA